MGDRNKPNVAFGSEFTSRMAQHPRVAYYPYPRPCPILVTMIGDELLVGARAAADKKVTAKLAALHAEDTGFTVFGGIKKQNNAKLPEDVQIWRLTKPGNGPHADVAEAVWSARKTLRAQKIPVEQVAPNHVLIPAPDYHACP